MDLSRKLPFYSNMPAVADSRADKSSHRLGKSLPATVAYVSGSIVTVNFEMDSDFVLPQIQVPIFGAEYIRLPVQVGCKGFVVPCDYYLGGMSGLGSGKAKFRLNGNLTNLVFFPVGNTDFSEVDGNELTLYGVSGVKIKDSVNGSSSVYLTSGSVVVSHGGSSITIDGSGVSINGTLTINGQAYTAHTHTNGNGGNPTGGVII